MGKRIQLRKGTVIRMREKGEGTAERTEKQSRRGGLWGKPDDETMRERQRIRAFDEAVLSYQSSGLPIVWARKFWGGLMVIFTTVGACTIGDESFGKLILLTGMWALLAPYFYISTYLRIRENGSTAHLYGKIRYLPVDIRQVKIVRIGYLIQMLRGPIVISLVIQIFIALVTDAKYLILRLLFVLIAGGLIPFLANAAAIWSEPR